MAETAIAYGEITILDLMDMVTYIYYAEDENGTGATIAPTAKSKYIGIYNGPYISGGQPAIPPEGTKWTKYVGNDGKGIESVTIYYAASKNGTQPPEDEAIHFSIDKLNLQITDPVNSFKVESSVLYFLREDTYERVGDVDGEYILGLRDTGWNTSVPVVPDGWYLWIRTVTKYSNGDSSITYQVSKKGEDGEKGDKGDKGDSITIISTLIEYATSTNGESAPESGWSEDIPTLQKGQYLWVKTTVKYSDETIVSSYSVSYSGEDGKDGEDANTYYIETNQEEIIFFREKDKENKENDKIIFSPTSFSFTIYENPKQSDSKPLSLTKENFSLVTIKGNDVKEIADNFTKLENNIVSFNVEDYYNSLEENKTYIITNGLQIFRFSYLINNKVAAMKVFQLRRGLSEDMATFSLYAGGFNSAIQNTKLNFSANGLDIYNGGLRINKITEESSETVFEADEYGDLYVKGNIEADSGFIGGFAIKDNKLYSTENIDSNGNIDFDRASIQLDGEKGIIYAYNIDLGVGARITQEIILGDARLYNPAAEGNNNKVLESGGILLKDDGTMRMGDILIDKDFSNNYYIASSNNNWKISASGIANFQDIYANNLHLQNSILEIGSVQSLGSLMLIKDAWEIIETNEDKTVLTIKLPTRVINLKENDYVYDGTKAYKINGIELINKNTEGQADIAKITLNKSFEGLQNTITKLGTPTTESKPGDCILSLLGESGNNIWSFANGNSITLSTFRENVDDGLSYKKTLVLGDLTGITANGGTGLYAENVHLYGSLTTQGLSNDNKSIFAGINTQSTQNSSKFTNEKVILFAGAKSENSIGESAFHVTDEGSLYASKGTFKGAIITESKIESSEIHTAKIYGTGATEQSEASTPALSIYDTANKGGIVFKESKGANEEVTLRISNNSFSIREKPFVSFINNEVNFTTENLQIFGNQIKSLDNQSILLNDSLEISNNSVISKNATYLQQDVYFGSDDKHHYTQAEDENGNLKGYDLYIN